MLNWDDYLKEEITENKQEKTLEKAEPQVQLQQSEPVANTSNQEAVSVSTLTEEDMKLAKEDLDTLEGRVQVDQKAMINSCLLYTSPSPRDQRGSRMPSSA